MGTCRAGRTESQKPHRPSQKPRRIRSKEQGNEFQNKSELAKRGPTSCGAEMDTTMRWIIGATALTAAVACEGDLQGDKLNGDSNETPGGSVDGMGKGEADARPDLSNIETADPETLLDGVPVQSRVPRLSQAEYDRSVSDLLLAKLTPSDLFPAEQPNLGPYEDVGARGMSERLLQEIVAAAEELAEQAVGDEARYSAIVGCATQDNVCRDSFIQKFGRRAYRRPLTNEELARFQLLFDQGDELVQTGDAFRDGVQLVLEAVLQSAKFLYRPEQGSGDADEVGETLSDFEIATRLSYLFWGTGPDEELLEAALAGQLSTDEGVAIQALRLADDPRMRERVLDFHDRWLQMEGLVAAAKDPTVYPDFGPELAGSMHDEMHAFVEEVTLTRQGGIVQLLNTAEGAVDASLASLYGLPGTFSEQHMMAPFPPESGRRGLLTQAAFLTGHSSASTRTSPILRGVFVLNRLLCQGVPPPPAGAEMEEPDTPPAEELVTTRQYFTWKTSMAACATCHNAINPTGFAFENFDGIGAHRTTENGAPVDAAGSTTVGGTTFSYENAAEFSEELSALSRTRSCYAINWLSYAYGREETAGDSRTLGRITAGLASSPYGARDLLMTLTRGAAFTHLPTY